MDSQVISLLEIVCSPSSPWVLNTNSHSLLVLIRPRDASISLMTLAAIAQTSQVSGLWDVITSVLLII